MKKRLLATAPPTMGTLPEQRTIFRASAFGTPEAGTAGEERSQMLPATSA